MSDTLTTPAVSRRVDGWSAAHQRTFLEAIADGHAVDAACARVGLSASSAYAFRRTAKGAAFALGWRAAALVARDVVAETLLARALHGQTDTWTRADGSTVTRHRHDNGLALRLLTRLDRQMEAAADADVQAARLVAQEFDAYLDLVGRDGGPARAGLFLAQRTPASSDADPAHDLSPIYALAAADRLARTGYPTAQEVPVADLDPAQRDRWTAEQWTRAEAAGLVALAPPPPEAEAEPDPAPEPQLSQHSPSLYDHVWWDQEEEEWRTDFPPPAVFDGEEEGRPGLPFYERTLTREENEVMDATPDPRRAAVLAALAARRDALFGFGASVPVEFGIVAEDALLAERDAPFAGQVAAYPG